MHRAAPRANGGIGGGLGPIGRGGLVGADRDQGEQLEALREPSRLTTDPRKARISAPFGHAFQHRPSNRPATQPRNPQKSAIQPRAPDPAELEQLARVARADRAPSAARNAKSFASPRPQNGAAGQSGALDRDRSRISARQNIREPQKSATFAAIRPCGSGAEPLWNLTRTTKPLYINDKGKWFSWFQLFHPPTCARGRVGAHAHHARGSEREPREPHEKRRKYSRLMVLARFRAGSRRNRPPDPCGRRNVAGQLTGTKNGSGQGKGSGRHSAATPGDPHGAGLIEQRDRAPRPHGGRCDREQAPSCSAAYKIHAAPGQVRGSDRAPCQFLGRNWHCDRKQARAAMFWLDKADFRDVGRW